MSRRRSAGRRVASAVSIAGILAGASACPAVAKINPAVTLDGPSADVVDIGGAAMAVDGTGAVVYRKRIGGRAHIFVSRFDGTAWRAPIRVDNGQDFDSSWPVIAAGKGGRLLVAWVQEGGESTDRMWGSLLGPGALTFQEPILIDFNVGEATATYPSLSMNETGTGYLAYRVVNSTSQSNPALPDNTIDGEIRVARTTGYVWTSLGHPMDRNPIAPQRTPNAANGPQIAADRNGTALVAWQEQNEFGVDGIFARRVFGGQVGIPLQVSPSSYNGVQLNTGADSFALDGAGFGSGAVAFRQLADPAAGLPAARVFTNSIPDSFTNGANAFLGARIEDGGFAAPSAPSVAVAPTGQTLTVFGSGVATIATDGDDTAAGNSERIDDGATGVPGDAVAELGSDGAAVVAHKSSTARGAGAGVIERRTDGVPVRALLSGSAGGAIRSLKIGGSGLGDAIVGWLQGDGSGAQIVGAIVDAPPQQFAAGAPTGWQRGKTATLTWEQPAFALGAVTYSVTVDDEEIASGLTTLRSAITLSELEDGALTAVIVAQDSAGQDAESIPVDLKIDRHRPTIRFRVRKRKLTVTVSDSGSGIRKSGTWVKFPGQRKKKKFKRSASRTLAPGVYIVRVRASDNAKHVRTVIKRIVVK